MQTFSQTIKLKTIFPMFDDFKAGVQSDTFLDPELPDHAKMYRYIMNRYANSNIAYDTREAFIRHFMLEYENSYEQYVTRVKWLASMYDLTIPQLQSLLSSVTNIATHNNTEVKNPKEPLPYITAQTFNQRNENIADAVLRRIQQLTDKYLFDFLDRFRVHFLKGVSVYGTIYKTEKGDR